MSNDENTETAVRNGDSEVERLRAEVEKLQEVFAALQAEIDDMKANVGGLGDIQGDENVAPGSGFIEFDRSVPKHPVVRFCADRLLEGGGGEVEVKGVDTKGNETSAVATKSIAFTTGDDSKVGFVVDDDGEGNVTVAVDVYWK